MKDMMTYNGYFGSVHYNDTDSIFYGKLEFIRAIVSYEGTDVDSLRRAFRKAVDDYLDFCREKGKPPEKPFKGTFNVRLSPDLHQRLSEKAINENMTLNAYIKTVLEKATAENRQA
jgi:predicted HicB family RNase H-like nuclease